MYTRKLIDFLFPETPQIQPVPSVGTSPKGDFDWPPSADDLEAFSVVSLHADDGSEVAPLSDGA